MTHGTHGPQWVADEIRKAEKMTDHFYNAIKSWSDKNPPSQQEKIDTSPEAVERLANDMQVHMPWGRGANTLRALSARVAELEQRNVALGEAVAYAEQRAATLATQLKEAARQAISDDLSLQTALDDKRALEAKLAKAVDVDLIEQAINDVLSEGGDVLAAARYVARCTLAEIQETKESTNGRQDRHNTRRS